MLFKLSNLNSNLALILGYLNPALNNSALGIDLITFEREKVITVTCAYRSTWFQHQYYVDPNSKSARKTELYGQQAEEKNSKIINKNRGLGNEGKKKSKNPGIKYCTHNNEYGWYKHRT